MPQDTLYILAATGELPRLTARNVFPAWLAYRLSPDLRLLRSEGPGSFHGGVMVVSGCAETPTGDPRQLCRALLRECSLRSFRGLLLDLDHPAPVYEQLSRLLARDLPHQGVSLFLPECLAAQSEHCRVLISSALSGGSLEQRLLEALAVYGAERVVLAVEKTAEDFTLPAPTGCGRPLSQSELENMIRDLRPRIHFSRPLCARYFTYFRDERVHFTLFDDADTLKEKLACARACGVHRFLLPWREISASPEDFLPQ